MDEENNARKKKKKKGKGDSDNHSEKMSELKTWIEEQMQKEDIKGVDDHEAKNELMEPVKQVKIDKKDASGKKEEDDINKMKMLRHQLPGNHLISEKEESRMGVRDNRYGINGDNGYGQIVEIKREKM
mmetsp:Transcript_3879/g.3813  ORF Transcript_3879/g.3813 Transcript_3879/m.3813 type:complete len:128 (+) Transcript_3879:430-813(+)|eukprot:CAMPEP_0170565810 /NCGR_PEP_ID=MMETSP0211-20121228/79424_1 /TAXON_ID=311385 /ORGANISM="Pseudokeronopsis sp., Strain OXSARD2" /LENGTH=127 /DNA_ID=CAMNT_0010886787 /DNA_START=145 /DNA_END=528 /DNA_ORIENTATION=-